MDKFPMMLFQASPTGESLQNIGRFATLIVNDEDELTASREAGWFESPEAALAPPVKTAPDDAPPTADEMRERLRELGVTLPEEATEADMAFAIAAAQAKASEAPASESKAPAPESKKPAARR